MMGRGRGGEICPLSWFPIATVSRLLMCESLAFSALNPHYRRRRIVSSSRARLPLIDMRADMYLDCDY